MKCEGCGQEFKKYRGGLPCHGPCPVGEKIFVPAPRSAGFTKSIEERIRKMTQSKKWRDGI
jgi:hypothetical protein